MKHALLTTADSPRRQPPPGYPSTRADALILKSVGYTWNRRNLVQAAAALSSYAKVSSRWRPVCLRLEGYWWRPIGGRVLAVKPDSQRVGVAPTQ